MNIENELDGLKKIRPVDAPPFLLTRIRQQIRNLGNAPAPVQWKWAFAASFIFILVLNLSVVLTKTASAKNTGIETVVNSMQLSNSNAFYHE